MSFWVIFLCLLIGAVIGFEFGRYTAIRKVKDTLSAISDGIKETTEKMQKMANETKTKGNGILEKLGVVNFDTRYYHLDDTNWAKFSRAIDTKAECKMCSDLITSMVSKGALDSEIARVVRYSMVALDAERLHLDWVTAKSDEGIDILKAKYLKNEETKEEIGNGEGV